MLQKKFKFFLFFTQQKEKKEIAPLKKPYLVSVQMEQRNGNQKLPKLDNKNMEGTRKSFEATKNTILC